MIDEKQAIEWISAKGGIVTEKQWYDKFQTRDMPSHFMSGGKKRMKEIARIFGVDFSRFISAHRFSRKFVCMPDREYAKMQVPTNEQYFAMMQLV